MSPQVAFSSLGSGPLSSSALFRSAKSFTRTAVVAVPLALPLVLLARPALVLAQEASPTSRVPLDQVLGTVSAVNTSNKSFTVKEDKTGTEYSVSAAAARRFLKVEPGEKDLKKAQPIDFSAISAGDRVLARGHKAASGPTLEAAIVVVMTAGELQQKHQAELADWQKRGSHGVVAAVDATAHTITMTSPTAAGRTLVTVTTTPETQFTRYASGSMKYADAKPSSFAEVKVGDQLRVLGNSGENATQISAEKIVSGTFRTVAATVVSVSSDGKQIDARDLQTKQPLTIALTDDSVVRRLPPPMAAMLARRLNPGAAATGTHPNGNSASPPHSGNVEQPASPDSPASSVSETPSGGGRRMGGDLSQVLERAPKISASELKSGDAVVISGGAGADPAHLTATSIIAGVEPMFASAPSKAGRSAALDNWNLDAPTGGGEQ
jgi:hypothetical protein